MHHDGLTNPSRSAVANGGLRWRKYVSMMSQVLLDGPQVNARDYSVRLAGMTAWDEHLPSLAMAEESAAEPRAMGLADVSIVDEETGEVVE
jgi:hypothetical protein